MREGAAKANQVKIICSQYAKSTHMNIHTHVYVYVVRQCVCLCTHVDESCVAVRSAAGGNRQLAGLT